MGTGSSGRRQPFADLGGKSWTWLWWQTARWAGSVDLLQEDFFNRNFEGLSARFDETSLVPVGLALVASLKLIQNL